MKGCWAAHGWELLLDEVVWLPPPKIEPIEYLSKYRHDAALRVHYGAARLKSMCGEELGLKRYTRHFQGVHWAS